VTEDVLHRVNFPIELALQAAELREFYRSQINDIFSAEDWVTTLVAAAGEQNTLLRGYDTAGKTFSDIPLKLAISSLAWR
jgi:hypothetical protein